MEPFTISYQTGCREAAFAATLTKLFGSQFRRAFGDHQMTVHDLLVLSEQHIRHSPRKALAYMACALLISATNEAELNKAMDIMDIATNFTG